MSCYNLVVAQQINIAKLNAGPAYIPYTRYAHIYLYNHSYRLSLGDGNEDGIITFDGKDHINLVDDSTNQQLAVSLTHNPIVLKLEQYATCWSFEILDDTGKSIKYKQISCDNLIDDTLINRLPSIKVQNFVTGTYTSLDTLALLSKSEKILLVHFLSSNCAPCIDEMSLIKEIIKRHIKIIYFVDRNSDKTSIKKLFDKYKIKDDLYLGGNDAIGRKFNWGFFPFSILFINNRNPIYLSSYESVLNYLYEHPSMVK